MQAGVLDDRPQRGREIPYLMAASHSSLAIPDLLFHTNQIDFDGMRKLCAEVGDRKRTRTRQTHKPHPSAAESSWFTTAAERACADAVQVMPYEWSHMDEPMVWFEMESNARYPGFHTGCVMGKAYFMKLFRERAMQLGNDFALKRFIDDFLAAGMIPMSLTRWEMTGETDELDKLGLHLAEAAVGEPVAVRAARL